MIESHAAADAFERLGERLDPRADAADLQCVRAFLAESQAQLTALASEHEHLRSDRDRWSARALQLEAELAAARERERRMTAELVALLGAAQALIGADGDADALAGATAGLRAALAGDQVQALVLELQETTSTATLHAVLRRMFAKMRTREALAQAAERWVIDQLRRQTPPFALRLHARCPAPPAAPANRSGLDLDHGPDNGAAASLPPWTPMLWYRPTLPIPPASTRR